MGLFRLTAARLGELPAAIGEADVTDWGLLRQAVREVAGEVNRQRATVQVARGALEQSRRLRQ